MNRSFVFGYGSLVNRATHDYADVHPARITGWRRVWRHVEGRSVAFLTVVRSGQDAIDGLIASVDDAAWPDLDIREASYLREQAANVAHPLPPGTDIRIYHAPEDLHRLSSVHHPILLSYLDVVVQGFHREFGPEGVQKFFETTDGWEAPVLNDRAAPRYTRHQSLTAEETEMADAALAGLGVRVLSP